MEKAIMISSIDILDNNYIWYIGDEFCSNLITIEKVLEYKKYKTKKVLLTPILTEEKLNKINKILKINKNLKIFDEITVNDIGLLKLLFLKNNKEIKINIGRLLISSLSYSISYGYFKEIIFNKININSFEIDSKEQLNFLPNNVNIHLYFPYKYITLTRICPFKKKILRKCDRSCPDNYLKLTSDITNNFFLRKNAYFYKNTQNEILEILKDKRIKRVIKNG